jgi:hypothetical protein
MRDGVLLSGTLHIFVLFLVLFGLPFFWEPETVRMTVTPITVVSSEELTAPKVVEKTKTVEKKKEPPQPPIPPAPVAPTLPEPEVTPEPPTTPVETKNETPPKEEPNPAPQESANPQPEDTPEPVIAEPPKEEPPPPQPLPQPTEEVAEVKDVPVPPQKPEPPKKKKVEKKDETKKTNEDDFVGDVINKLTDEQTAALPPQEEVAAVEPETEGIPQRLPAGEEDALRNYIRQCWIWPGGSASSDNLVVTLEIKLKQDATLAGVDYTNETRSRMGDPVYRSFAESTKRAVQKCGASGQQFPMNHERDYSVWGFIIANFSPSSFN